MLFKGHRIYVLLKIYIIHLNIITKELLKTAVG